MNNQEILKLDFYDFCGTASICMSDKEKIEYYKNIIKKSKNGRKK